MASYIPALVIETNGEVFVNSDGSIGAIKEIPTPDGGGNLDGDVWANPVNRGVYSGFTYQPYNVNNSNENVAPGIYSVAAFKLSSRLSSQYWIVLGTQAQYVTAAGGGTALPAVWPAVSHTKPLLPACQTIDAVDVNGKYNAVLGIPTLPAGQMYFIYGSLNGVQLTAASSTGYPNLTSLLSFLNSGTWANVGTWTKTSDNLTLIATQTAGTGTDILCATLITINASA